MPGVGELADWNGYVFVGGDPMNAVDPSGEYLLELGWTVSKMLAGKLADVARTSPAVGFANRFIYWVWANQVKLEIASTLAGLIAPPLFDYLDEGLERLATNKVAPVIGKNGNIGHWLQDVLTANATEYETIDHIIEDNGKKARNLHRTYIELGSG